MVFAILICGEDSPTVDPAFSAGSTMTVSSSSALRNALSQAQAGDVIVIADRAYRGDFQLSASGQSSLPITIEAETAGGAIFIDSLFTLNGNDAELKNLVFKNGQVTVKGNRNRVTNNLFEQGQPGGNASKLHSAVAVYGSNNRIDHNEVRDWQRRGLRVIPNSSTKDNRFDHNYLHDFWRADPSANSGEALQAGIGRSDELKYPRTIFEYNLLLLTEADSEAISIKSSGNVIRFNTFLDSNATVTNRHGVDNTWQGNTIDNMKAMAIYGDNNSVLGNALTASHLIIRTGNTLAGQLTSSKTVPAATNTTVACNVVNQPSAYYLGVGVRIPGGASTSGVPAQNTTLASNDARLVFGDHKNTQQINQSCSNYQAAQVSPSQVGPTWRSSSPASAPALAPDSTPDPDPAPAPATHPASPCEVVANDGEVMAFAADNQTVKLPKRLHKTLAIASTQSGYLLSLYEWYGSETPFEAVQGTLNLAPNTQVKKVKCKAL